jgi:polysaccharide export outer membrane protein
VRRVIVGGVIVCACVTGNAAWAQAQRQAEAQQTPATVTPATSPLDDEALNRLAGAPIDPKSYMIGPEDVLFVRVWREPELTGLQLVRPDGVISLPLVGEIKAAGLTPVQLQVQVAKQLGEFVNKPDVLVSVQAVRSRKYLISGEVNRPGPYPLVRPTTVLEAIVVAGGLREWANKKDIVIMRGDKRLKFNYKEVIDGKNLGQNIALENNDHVLVK